MQVAELSRQNQYLEDNWHSKVIEIIMCVESAIRHTEGAVFSLADGAAPFGYRQHHLDVVNLTKSTILITSYFASPLQFAKWISILCKHSHHSKPIVCTIWM